MGAFISLFVVLEFSAPSGAILTTTCCRIASRGACRLVRRGREWITWLAGVRVGALWCCYYCYYFSHSKVVSFPSLKGLGHPEPCGLLCAGHRAGRGSGASLCNAAVKPEANFYFVMRYFTFGATRASSH